jgi:MFS transporter, DHA1 family, multidrug resistance protein
VSRGRTLRFALILGGLSAFGPLSIDMYLPAFPSMVHELQTGQSQVQLTLTAFMVGISTGQVVAGSLSDAMGRRRPLLVGLVLYTVASLACAFAPTVYALAGLRLLQGFGAAAGVVIARAVVRDLYSGVAMARFFSLLMLVNGLGPVLAPLIGGQLMRFTTWVGVFVVLTGCGLALLLASAFGLPETLPDRLRGPVRLGHTVKVFGRLLVDKSFVGYALSAGLLFGAMFSYISGSSFVLQEEFKLSPQAYSLVFGVNSVGIVAMGQLNRLLLRRFDPRAILGRTLVVAALGGLGVFVAVVAHLPLFGLLVPLFVMVASIGLVFPNSTALALAEHPDTAGSASALLGLLQFLIGGLVAPLVGIGGSALPMGIAIGVLPLAAVVVFRFLTRPVDVDQTSEASSAPVN